MPRLTRTLLAAALLCCLAGPAQAAVLTVAAAPADPAHDKVFQIAAAPDGTPRYLVRYPSYVRITGSVVDNGDPPAPGTVITVRATPFGIGAPIGFAPTTDLNGLFGVAFQPLRSARVRSILVGDQSDPLILAVAPSLAVAPRLTLANGRLQLHGTLTSPHPASDGRLLVQRLRSGSWVTTATTRSGPHGRFTLPVGAPPRVAGRYLRVVRVVFRPAYPLRLVPARLRVTLHLLIS